LLQVLGRDPFAPPSLPEAMQQSGAGHEVVRLLAQRQEIVRLSPEIALTRAAYDRAVGLVQELAAGGSPVTVATLRDRMGASRRPVLALLEYLDAQKVTRRIGDARVLV
jgi:selenocysteine-specific elongation factor